jgi:predicted ATPase/transcriptional regulator with XRE-family HTH domain
METRDPAHLAALVRRRRTAAALSQEALAERAGVSVRAISDLERGVHRTPRLETVRLVADALGLSEADRANLLTAARPHVMAPVHAGLKHSVLAAYPLPSTRLIGRETEKAVLAGLLVQDDVRLVTLTGPGGTGKTRLALTVASDARGHYPDGVCFVDLSPLRDPALVIPTIAIAVGVQQIVGESLRETLGRVLHDRRLLLVLDNFEQLLSAAPLVADLLTHSVHIKILATSRAPLRLRAEREYPVPPLGLPPRQSPPSLDLLSQFEAVRLFADRAQAVQPDFALNDANISPVAEICHRLDGLPLAIELAAARIRMLPPSALLARLERRLPLLESGTRDAPERQRTLRDTIAWSYNLLDPAARLMLQRLAVFVGGCTLEAAEAVGQDQSMLAPFAALEVLVEQNLVRHEAGLDGEPRFPMLETIREFALEQLALSGHAESIQALHAAYFLTFWERAEPEQYGRGAPLWRRRFGAELGNVRASLAWFEQQHDADQMLQMAALVGHYFINSSRLQEGREWLERALSLGGSDMARLSALFWAAHISGMQHDPRQAETWVDEGIALAQERGALAAWGQLLYARQLISWFAGDLDAAIEQGEAAVAQLRIAGAEAWLAFALGDLGNMLVRRGDVARGTRLFEEGIALHRALGNLGGIGIHTADLATTLAATGSTVSTRHFRDSLQLLWEAGDRWWIQHPLGGLAQSAVSAGRFEHAARLLGAAEQLRIEGGADGRPPEVRVDDEQTAYMAAQALGDATFERALAAGRDLPLPQVVSEALDLADALTAADGISAR